MRYRISFLNNYLENDSIGVILTQLQSMVGKILVTFEDRELNKIMILKNNIDYQNLCNEY